MAKKRQRENARSDIPKSAKGARCNPARRGGASSNLKALARRLLNGGSVRSTPAAVVATASKPSAAERSCCDGGAVKPQSPALSARVRAGHSDPVQADAGRAETDSLKHATAADSCGVDDPLLATAALPAVTAGVLTARERRKKKRTKKKQRSKRSESEAQSSRDRKEDLLYADVAAAAAVSASSQFVERGAKIAGEAAESSKLIETDVDDSADVDDGVNVDDGVDDIDGSADQPDMLNTTWTSSCNDVTLKAVHRGFWVRDSNLIRIDSADGSQPQQEALVSICETAFPLVMQGMCQLRHVGGRALRLHGFVLRPGSAFWNVYSPNLYPHLVLDVEDDADRGDASVAAAASSSAGSAVVRMDLQVLPETQPWQPPPAPSRSVTLAVRPLTTADALLRNAGTSYRRLLELPALRPDCPALLASLGGVRLLAAAGPESNGLLEPAVGLHESLSQLEATATLPVVLVCGGKNAGKSTLTRHIANHLLNRYDSVFYLDVDPGQTEFTPPGCVALKRVITPLFGPPWTHVGDVDVSVRFLGSTSPYSDPDQYMRDVRSLLEEYEMHRQQGVPLIVNTMGWVQSLGLNLLIDTLRLVRPSLVVQLSSASSANKNLPPLVPELLTCDAWNMEQGEACDDRLNFISCHLWSHSPRTSTTAASADESISEACPALNTGALGAPQCRDLMTFAYFGQLWSSSAGDQRHSDPQSFINAAPPYAVPWDALVVQLCAVGGARVPAHLVLGALNASVVALASVVRPEVHDMNSAVKMIDPGVPTSYLGFGLVRAIDVDRRLFYITTPVDPKLLHKVNCLRLGTGIELPAAILTKQGCLAGRTLPYVDVHRQGVGVRSSQSTPRNYCAFGRNRR